MEHAYSDTSFVHDISKPSSNLICATATIDKIFPIGKLCNEYVAREGRRLTPNKHMCRITEGP